MKTMMEIQRQWERIIMQNPPLHIANKAWKAKCNLTDRVCEALHVPSTILCNGKRVYNIEYRHLNARV